MADQLYGNFLRNIGMFAQQMQDHIQTATVLDQEGQPVFLFNEQMYRAISRICKTILMTCPNPAPVVDSDMYETSSDSGVESSVAREQPRNRRYNRYVGSNEFRVNFAHHLQRLILQKLTPGLFSDGIICHYAIDLAEAARLDENVIHELGLDAVRDLIEDAEI